MRVRPYQSSSEQSLFDVALQHYGSIQDGIAWLISDNPSVIDENGKLLHGNATLQIRNETANLATVDFLQSRSIIPVTSAGLFQNNENGGNQTTVRVIGDPSTNTVWGDPNTSTVWKF